MIQQVTMKSTVLATDNIHLQLISVHVTAVNVVLSRHTETTSLVMYELILR